jgi:hypothetical protein
VLPVVWREVESARWKVEFGSRARAGKGSCCDGSRILDLILPLLSLANAWGNCWELEMEWCMFDLLEGDGNGGFCGVGSGIGDSELEPFGPFCVTRWDSCFDNRRSLGILRLSFHSVKFSGNVLLKRSRRDSFSHPAEGAWTWQLADESL